MGEACRSLSMRIIPDRGLGLIGMLRGPHFVLGIYPLTSESDCLEIQCYLEDEDDCDP